MFKVGAYLLAVGFLFVFVSCDWVFFLGMWEVVNRSHGCAEVLLLDFLGRSEAD